MLSCSSFARARSSPTETQAVHGYMRAVPSSLPERISPAARGATATDRTRSVWSCSTPTTSPLAESHTRVVTATTPGFWAITYANWVS